MAAEHGPTAGEYIIHHLTHLQNAKPKAVVDFSVFSFDSLFFSILLGIVGCFVLWMAARKASSGVPGRFQAAVELLVEMVDSQAKGIVHNAESRKFIAPGRERFTHRACSGIAGKYVIGCWRVRTARPWRRSVSNRELF